MENTDIYLLYSGLYPKRLELYSRFKSELSAYNITYQTDKNIYAKRGTDPELLDKSASGTQLLQNKYIRLISEHKVAIFASDIYGYFVKKYAECLMAGVLLIAPDVVDAREAGLIAGKHFIKIEDNLDLVVKQVREILDHFDRYREIATEGHNWYLENGEKLCDQTYENIQKYK